MKYQILENLYREREQKYVEITKIDSSDKNRLSSAFKELKTLDEKIEMLEEELIE